MNLKQSVDAHTKYREWNTHEMIAIGDCVIKMLVVLLNEKFL